MKVNKAKLKAIVAIAVILLAGGSLGFIVGYYEGTGVMPTLYPSESVRPPSNLVMVSAIETEQTLSALQDKEYGNGYNCVDYAWDAMRLLRWGGQSSVIIGLDIDTDPELDHALLLVPTQDKGWIFVEPQTGKQIASVVVGGRYVGQTIKSIDIMTIVWMPYEDYISGISSNVTGESDG